MKFFDSPEDVEWLRTTHLNETKHEFKSFLMEGNEDSPTALDLFATSDPSCTDPYWEVRKGTDGEWAWTHVDGGEAYRRWEQSNVDY